MLGAFLQWSGAFAQTQSDSKQAIQEESNYKKSKMTQVWLDRLATNELLNVTAVGTGWSRAEKIVAMLTSDYGVVGNETSVKKMAGSPPLALVCKKNAGIPDEDFEQYGDGSLEILFNLLLVEKIGKSSPSELDQIHEMINIKLNWFSKNCGQVFNRGLKNLINDFTNSVDKGIVFVRQDDEKTKRANESKQRLVSAANEQKMKMQFEEKEKRQLDELAIQAIKDAKSRISGLGEYKFGMSYSQISAIKGRPGTCSNFDSQVYNGYAMLLGRGCYRFAGLDRNLGFFFPVKLLGGVNYIVVWLNDSSALDIKNSLNSLSSSFGKPIFTASNSMISAFDRGEIPSIVLAAYNEWSVNYLVQRSKGQIVHQILYVSDTEALGIKKEQLNLLNKFSW